MAKILIISPEGWNEHFVSKHHYAVELSRRGNDVIFFGPPTKSTCLLVENVSFDNVSIFLLKSGRVARLLRFYPLFVRRFLEKCWLKKVEELIGGRVDVVWLFENSRFYDLGFAEDRLKIYHQVDLNQNFYPAVAARTADICFCTSNVILNRLLKFNSRSFKIHHGCPSIVGFNELSRDQLKKFDCGRQQVALIGNMEIPYLDFDLICSVVKGYPRVLFHFVGGFREDGVLRSKLLDCANLVWWGKVQASHIPLILQHIDVVMVAYKAALYRDQVSSPHKFMEYFSSGKVIVSTYTDEYKDKLDLVEMLNNDEDFFNHLGLVLSNLSFYNSDSMQNLRKNFASNNSYSNQLSKIKDHLNGEGLNLLSGGVSFL